MERNVTMPTLESVKNFKAAMASEQGAFGPFMITSDPAFVEAAGYAGYDFVLLDMEHGPGTFENLQNLIRAANVSGVCPVVRVPRGTDIWIDQALDVGAGAVMIPQIDSADQARRCVRREILSPRHPWHLPLCPFRRLWRRSRRGLLRKGAGHRGDPSGRGSKGHRQSG